MARIFQTRLKDESHFQLESLRKIRPDESLREFTERLINVHFTIAVNRGLLSPNGELTETGKTSQAENGDKE